MPGRPNLYRTTHEFLDIFGLASLSELPDIEKESVVEDKKDLFTSIYKEEKEDVGI